MKTYLTIIFLPLALLFVSCFQQEDEIISDGVQRLVIDNAFYMNDLFSCTIQFDYYVTEDTCNVGGYGIDWGNDSRSSINWYMVHVCIPGVRYTIQETYERPVFLPPIVSMQGYRQNDSESYPELISRITLQSR